MPICSLNMKFLSLRLCEHDSNISFFDGNAVQYFKLERKTNIKHDAYCDLFSWKQDAEKIFNIDLREIDEIAIVVDSWLYHDGDRSTENFFPAMEWNHLKVECPVWRVNHHYAHALSYWPVMHDEPIVSVVIDGFGDLDASWSVFKKGEIVSRGSKSVNGSIGVQMAQAAEFLGIRSPHGVDYAGKLMGLQSYGKNDEGFLKKLRQYDMGRVGEIFEQKHWREYKQDDLLAGHLLLDWAHTFHTRIEEVLIDFFKQFCEKDDLIFYSGGVAQNIVWNTALKKEFPNMVIAPHSSDEGLSLGALEWLRRKNKLPGYSIHNFPYIQSDQAPGSSPSLKVIDETAHMLSMGKIVAWYQGNGEIGPRALGNRSILMRPDLPKDKINNIKKRENYRPFGASILEEHVDNYFFEYIDDPYMLYSSNFKNKICPAINHVDGTCRAQTVKRHHGDFRLLLEKFYCFSGLPLFLNTSLNLAGSPLMGEEDLATKFFNESTLDVLVVGDKIYKK